MEHNREPRNNHKHIWVYDKGTKDIQWVKNSLSSKWCWGNRTATYKKNESGPLP